MELTEFTPRALGSGDVTVRVFYCGICFSDVHTLDGDVITFKSFVTNTSSGVISNSHG